MAKVEIADDYVEIQLSLVEKLSRGERSRRVPLLHIKGVDTYPPEAADGSLRGGGHAQQLWGGGDLFSQGLPILLSTRDARDSSKMLTIDLCDEDVSRLIVDLEDESPDIVADRIRLAVAAAQASAIESMRSRSTTRELPPMPPSEPPPALVMQDSWEDTGEHGIPRRITPLPRFYSEPAKAMRLDDDRSLAKLGAWLIAFGLLCLVTGVIIVSGGAVPGLLAIGAGAACAALGGVALAVVLNHQ